MSKRRRILLLVACIALAGAAVVMLTPSNEPTYGGRTLSEWLEIYRFAGTEKIPWEQRDKAAEAVRTIGTNALPFLLEWIRYEPAPWQRRLGDIVDRGNAPFVLNRLAFSDRLLDRSFSAREGFQILGSAAHSALPDLLKMMNETNSWQDGRQAFAAVASFGEAAIGPMADALTNASNPQHRRAAWVAISMSYMGTNAAPLVPLLVQGTRDTNDIIVEGSVQALGSLRLLPKISVPALTNSLRHSNPRVRQWAAQNLRHFNSAARPAVPALIAARSDPEYIVRELAERALAEIAPETLTNAPPR